jgi:hypothetical protein
VKGRLRFRSLIKEPYLAMHILALHAAPLILYANPMLIVFADIHFRRKAIAIESRPKYLVQ